MAVKTYLMKQGDLEPTIRIQMVEDDEVTPIPITGFGFNLHIKKPVRLVKVGVIVDNLLGIVEFPWVAGDTADAGTFMAEIEVVYPGARSMTWPGFPINFRAQI